VFFRKNQGTGGARRSRAMSCGFLLFGSFLGPIKYSSKAKYESIERQNKIDKKK
jgi:hypothetical protein